MKLIFNLNEIKLIYNVICMFEEMTINKSNKFSNSFLERYHQLRIKIEEEINMLKKEQITESKIAKWYKEEMNPDNKNK